jgi:hypothetical protein
MTQVLHPSLYQVNTESIIDWTQFSENLPRPSLPKRGEPLPLASGPEGKGRERVGVKGLNGIAKTLKKQSIFPSPCPSPPRGEGR